MKSSSTIEQTLMAELELAYKNVSEKESALKKLRHGEGNGPAPHQTPIEIKNSEERYRRLFETAQDGILILDAESGAISDANPFILNLLEYREDELIGKRLWEIGAFVDVKDSKSAFEELQKKEYIRYEDLPLRTKTGAKREVEFVSNVYLVHGKKVIQCNIRDITERRTSDILLRDSEERYRRLFETAQDGILILDGVTGIITDANPFIIESLGYSIQELRGKQLWEIGAFIDVKDSKSAFEELQKKEYIRYKDLPLRTKSGVKREVEFVSNVYLVSGKKVIQCNIRDITERKQAEEKIHEIDERFSNAFENAPTGMALVSPEGRWLKTNRALTDLLGYSEKEFLDRLIADLTFQDDIKSSFDNIRGAINGTEKSYQVQKRYVHKQGHVITALLNTSLIRNAEGSPLYFISHIQDITERNRKEIELRESNEKFHQLSDNITDAFWIRSPDMSRVHYISPAFETIWGRTVESLYANPQEWPEFIHLEDRERVEQAFAALTGTNSSLDVEYRIVRPDGEIRLVNVRGFQVRNESGTVIRHIGIVTDITERREAEGIQRESERRFKEMLENIDLLALLLDREGKVTFCNDYLLRLTGYTRERVIGQNWFTMFIPPELGIEPVFINAMANGSLPQHNENELITAAGERRLISWNNIELRDTNGQLIGSSSIGEDITERKRAEQLLRASEVKFRNLIETLPDGFYRSTAAGRFLDVNPMLVKMLGYDSKEELLKIDIPTELYFAQEDRDVKNGVQKDDLDTEIYQLRKKDGSGIWVEDRCRYLKDESGNIQYHEGISRDISDRMLADEKLRKSEEKYRSIFENIQDVYFETRLDGTIEEISPAIVIVSKGQYQREDLIGYSMYDFYYDKADGQTALEELQKKGSISDFEVTLKNRDGSKIQCSVSSTLQYDAQGRPERIIGSLRDITERTTTLEAMRASEEQFRLLFDNSIDGILVTHPDGTIDSANSAACRIFGATEKEIIAMGRDGIVDTEDPRLLAALRELELTGKFSGELSLRRKDGSCFPGEISTSMYKDTKGNFVSSMSIRDISERKEAEKQIALLAHTLKSIIECVSVTDMDNTILFVNAAFLKTYGYTEEEIIGKDISVIRTPHQSFESTSGILSATLAGGWSGELLNRKKNGDEFPVSLSTSCVRDENGHAVALVGVATDITERRHDEIHLQMSEERYRRLVEFSPSAIIVHNHVTIIYVNPAAIKLLAARDSSELIGKPIRDILHEDHRESDRLHLPHNEINPTLPLSKEKFLRLDGATIDVEVVSLLIKYDGIPAMQDVVTDVTERNKIQQELFQSQKSESIGTLAAGIAHDFNNILGIILGYTGLMARSTINAQRQSESIAAINQAVQRGASLVRQILAFARKTDVALEPVDLEELVRELVSMLEQTFPKIITFKKNIPPDLPYILGNRTQIHQSLLNLCVNARDAMPNGGSITIDADTIFSDSMREQFPSSSGGPYVCFTVTDTGTGMSEATKNRIFDPFFTTKEQGKGTGLGLSVVYGIVQSHKGFITVQSQPGKGTSFHLYFPVPPASVQTIIPQEKDSFDIGGSETLLIVEDEELLRNMVTLLLEAKGYTILTAQDGAEGIALYKQHYQSIAIVLTDLGLPKIPGQEVYRQLKKFNPGVKVIFASGYFDPAIKTELVESGATHFIQKPYESNELLRTIRKALQ